MSPYRKCVCAVCLGLVLVLGCTSTQTGCATAPAASTNGVPNLAEVEPGIYRGGQPTAGGWSYLRQLGLTNDIKLNTQEESSDQAAVAAGLRVFYYPIDTLEQLVSGPSPQAMNQVVAKIGPGTYIHCEHGQDRTGLAVGLYRLKEGWSKAKAWQEMTNHGYHPALAGLTHYWNEQ